MSGENFESNNSDHNHDKGYEAADFARWENQFSGNVPFKQKVDDEIAEGSRRAQERRITDARLKTVEAGYNEDDAEVQEYVSETLVRKKMPEVTAQMDQQREAVAEQIRQESPVDIVSENAIGSLKAHLVEGEVGEYPLLDIDSSSPLYREAVARVFEKLGLPDPLQTLDAPAAKRSLQHRLLGRDKHAASIVTEAVALDGKVAEVTARRSWDLNRKRYTYTLGGGLKEDTADNPGSTE